MRLLFVYGTLKQGYRLNHRLADSRFIGKAKTSDKLRMIDLGSYPGLLEQPGETQIEGEVYSISKETLRGCDILEGVPNLYDRKAIRVMVERDGKVDELTAFAYFINPKWGSSAPTITNWPPKPSTT